MRRLHIILVYGGVFLICVGLFFVYEKNHRAVNGPPVSVPHSVTDIPTKASFEGIYTCLPHWDTTGPQTLECALGIQTGEATYYALDTNLLSPNSVFNLATGSRIRVEGTLVPIEQISSDHWQKYNVRGILQATSLQKL